MSCLHVWKSCLQNTTVGRPARIPKPSESIRTVPILYGATLKVQGTTENLVHVKCAETSNGGNKQTAPQARDMQKEDTTLRTRILAGGKHQRRAEQATKQYTSSETTEAGKAPGSNTGGLKDKKRERTGKRMEVSQLIMLPPWTRRGKEGGAPSYSRRACGYAKLLSTTAEL